MWPSSLSSVDYLHRSRFIETSTQLLQPLEQQLQQPLQLVAVLLRHTLQRDMIDPVVVAHRILSISCRIKRRYHSRSISTIFQLNTTSNNSRSIVIFTPMARARARRPAHRRHRSITIVDAAAHPLQPISRSIGVFSRSHTYSRTIHSKPISSSCRSISLALSTTINKPRRRHRRRPRRLRHRPRHRSLTRGSHPSFSSTCCIGFEPTIRTGIYVVERTTSGRSRKTLVPWCTTIPMPTITTIKTQ